MISSGHREKVRTALPAGEVAAELALSEKTVETHVSGILAKLAFADPAARAALYARARGMAP